MSKQLPVTVTLSNNTPPSKFKAESIEHTREVVCRAFNLPRYTKEALGEKHILHVYVLIKGRNHLVEEKPTKLVKVSPRHGHVYMGKAPLKPRQPEKKKHDHSGLRQQLTVA